MNHLTKVKLIQNLNEEELRKGVPASASWHQKYKDSCYIYTGGVNFDLNEGDLVTVFSQYGEIVDLRLARDKKTGKSRGFAFIAYEDQRSTILAVDNLNGFCLCGKVLRVDHVEEYKIPREYLMVKEDEDIENKEIYKPTGPDGLGWGEYRSIPEEAKHEFEELEQNLQDQHKREINTMDKALFVLDEDERWEQTFAQIVEKEKAQDENKNEEKKLRKEKKKLKKEKKIRDKEQKQEIKRKAREEKLKNIYKSYGVQNFSEEKPNIPVDSSDNSNNSKEEN